MVNAQNICAKECCKNGVWIRYKYAPHNTNLGRFLDWAKSYDSYHKPTTYIKDGKIDGGKWEGDTFVPCDKK